MLGPRADPGNTIHQGEMDGEMAERGGEKDKRKKREIQGGLLLSLTTKMEVR